jgi:micrococcal nuclease
VGPVRLIALASLPLLVGGCQGGSPDDGDSQSTTSLGSTETVVRVNDGDTLTLASGEKVRLVQIDAPELTDDCYGRAARSALLRLAPPRTPVRLERDTRLDGRDGYGRLLRYVVVDGENVNVTLVRIGAASPYFFRKERGRYASALLDAVDEARAARRGFWGACPDARLDPNRGSITGRG